MGPDPERVPRRGNKKKRKKRTGRAKRGRSDNGGDTPSRSNKSVHPDKGIWYLEIDVLSMEKKGISQSGSHRMFRNVGMEEFG